MTGIDEDDLIRRLRASSPVAGLGVDFDALAAQVQRRQRARRGLLAAGAAAVTVLALVVGSQLFAPRAGDATVQMASSGPSTIVAAEGSSTAAASAASTAPATAGRTELVGVGTVLEKDAGPRLCLGAILYSSPPQCSGPLITGWDWAAAPPSTSASGVRWGEYTVIGTFDGSTFTLTRPARPVDHSLRPRAASEPDFRTPCPVPPGGWTVIDPAKATQSALDATLAAAASIPGYAGLWLDQSLNPADPATMPELMNDPTKLVLNVRVVGDVTAAERHLRETWGGALCATTAALTQARLEQIQGELGARWSEIGLLSSATSPVANRVDAQVLFDDGRVQRQLDATYGRGAVVVTSALQPFTG